MPRAPKYIPVAASALAPSPANLYTGTSGWAYTSWKPGFYPAAVPSRAFLHVYASRLTSVEVNYTFRKLPTDEQMQGWLDATPPGFRFSFKAPQRITHFQRLRDSEETVAAFFHSLEPARAAGKLGPVLFQLPPNFAANPERLAAFLALPVFGKKLVPQIAFEFRHVSHFSAETYAILRQHNVALCIAESGELKTPDVATAGFRCYRLRCSGGYSARKLGMFAKAFTEQARTQEVFVYFKHEDEPTGALNAVAMLQRAARLSRTQVAGVGA